MPILVDTILILSGVVFLLLVGFAIPCILEIRRTAKDTALTLRILNENLPVIMKNLDEITTRVNRATFTVQGQIDDISLIVRKMKGLMILVVGLEEIIRRGAHLPFVPILRTCFAVSKGIQVFLRYLLSERPKSG